jgi:hypothetical protein
MKPLTEPTDERALPFRAAADLQDHLMMASNDLERLQVLLADACEVLARSFHGAAEQARALSLARHACEGAAGAAHDLMAHLVPAVTALQFQDLASQLIQHTNQRLRSCADRIARAAMPDDEDGPIVVREPPPRPNPITQDEMEAGSIELFQVPESPTDNARETSGSQTCIQSSPWTTRHPCARWWPSP